MFLIGLVTELDAVALGALIGAAVAVVAGRIQGSGAVIPGYTLNETNG